MPRLHLTLLGGFQARTDAGPAVSLATRKAQALLAYLALPPGRAHPRDKLATLLWGDTAEEQARASLRQALFALRKALPAGALVSEGETLALDRGAVEVDAVAFERRVTDGTPDALAEAAALYQGDLLAGLALREAPFEEWLLGERERLRELALEALAKLLAHQRSAGATEAALQTALRLVALDPLQEPVHRTLMRLYAQLGRRGAALRQYQACVSTLQRELGVEPEAETKQLYQEIVSQRPPRAAAGAPAPARADVSKPEGSLIGRAVELGRLRAALTEAQEGRGQVVLVLGEVGIGKTRLMGELMAIAGERNARVLAGRSYESEQVLPFGPWVDAFRASHAVDDLRSMAPAWRSELARLLPQLAGPGADPPRSTPDFLKVFEAVTVAVGVLGERRPLLLVLEDLHWADEMSVRLLAFVGRRLEASRVLVVATVREEDLAETAVLRRVLDELERERRLRLLTLSDLSREHTLALVSTLVRSGTDEAALARLGEAAWRVSGGNPFVVVETVRAQAQGLADSPATAQPALPPPVRQLVAGRLGRLSERGRLLTTVAAVIGRDFEFPLLRRAAGLADAEAAEGVEELVRRRVLQGVGERFDFVHDRIRDVVRADLLAPRRRVLHRSVAEAIEAVYADDLEPHVLALGLHYQGAEMWPQAMSYLRRAAVHAFARSAHREAATCFEHALAAASHLPRTPETLDQMLDLQLQLRTALWPLADFDRIARCLDEAEGLATALEDRARLGRIAAFMSVLRWVTGEFRTARRLGQSARDAAATLGDRPLRVMSSFYVGLAHHLLAEYREAEDAYQENVRELTDSKERYVLGTPTSQFVMSAAWLVLPLAERGVFAEGLAHGRAALRFADTAEDPFGIVTACYCLGYLHCSKGEVDRAIPLLERGVAVCREREFSVWLPQVTGYLGHAYAHAGRLEEGRTLLARAIEIHDATRGWPFRTLMTVHRGTAELLGGHLDAAGALGQEALALAREHGERGHEAWALRLLGQVAAETDPFDVGRAERRYIEGLGLATELGMRPLVAHCHLGRGRLYGRPGAGAKAREHLTAAATLYRDMDMGLWLAEAEAALRAPTH